MRVHDPPLITLLTDFGLQDTYVGQLKGAILALVPRAVIVDLSHGVPPHDVRAAAFLLQSALVPFPPGCVHVVVVDPGVGGARRGLVLEASGSLFVGPDNGVLSAALPDPARPDGDEPSSVAVPAGVRAFTITNTSLFRPTVAPTFHGRDIFGPVAARLASGLPVERVGPPAERVLALPPFRARRRNGTLRARVVLADRFGNLITDCRAEDLPDGHIRVRVGGTVAHGLVRTYEGTTGPVALIGSSGYLEIAVAGRSAAQELDLSAGAAVIIDVVGADDPTQRPG